MVAGTQIRRALRFAAPVLATRFDDVQAQDILKAMRSNYEIIASDVPRHRSPLNKMTLKIGVDTLVFYRALQTVLSQSEALTLIQSFVDNWMDGQFDTWLNRKVYANRRLHLLYRRAWFARVNAADELDGQKFEFLPPTRDLFYGVNVIRCGVVKFLTRMGAPEIGPYLCRGDIHIQKYLPKGIEFKRTQVIAEGGQCCDFRYYVVGT